MQQLVFVVFISVFLSGCFTQKAPVNKKVYSKVGPFLHYYEGIQNRLYGNYEDALSNLEIAKILEPNNDAIYYELAISYNMIGEVDSAIVNLEKAVELSPINKYYRSLLGMLYINQQMFDKALTNQQQLVLIDSLNINQQFQLALLQSEQKNFDQAVSILNSLEEQLGYNTRLAETRLRILIETNSLDNALAEVDGILNIETANPLYLLYRSEI
ncbi:MAG: tetratricopeptide repeat protein, partial [Tenuifilaceae bacterium]|nr:tetratricopeptide repeat protein [Tenuifilaceae bacterium]